MTLTKNELEDIDFGSLLTYVKNQLNVIEASGDENNSSKDELLSLCNALNDKIVNDYEKELAPYKNPPEYPPFIPSDHLRALMEKRAALKEQLLAWKMKHRNRKAKDMPSSILKEMSDLFKQIKTLQPQETEEYRNQMKERYDLEMKGYFKNRNKIESAEQQKRESRILEVGKIRQRIMDYFNLKEQQGVHRINWQILPPGTWSIDQITKHFKALEKADSDRKYDFERLEALKTLNPKTCYIGLEEFVGYVVFCFDYTDKAILENPIEGNAIYIIEDNWSELSHLTKRELLSSYFDKVKRIIHRGDWFERLKIEMTKSAVI